METYIKNKQDLEKVLSDISLKGSTLDFDWKFKYRPYIELIGENLPIPIVIEKGWFIWVEFKRPDCDTGKVGIGRGREELVISGSTVSSVVKTCWLLLELMIRHELMESFCWKGHRIFNPHHTVEELASLRKPEKSQNIEA